VDEDPSEPGRWRIRRTGASDPMVARMVEGYLAELSELIPEFDHRRASPPDAGDFEWPNGAFVLVTDGSNEPVACGALRRLSPKVGELRRMWVVPAQRGTGLGRVLLGALERLALKMDLTELRLDTNKELSAALSLYRRSGYSETPRYNDNPYADFWLVKSLPNARQSSGSGQE
jgi:GNAT superfamily N-acetyltransferase